MKISIIIPAYNEENSISIVLDKIFQLKLPDFIYEKEVIVIDDFSKDNTYQLIKDYQKKEPKLKIFHHEINKGKGAAVHEGFKIATGDIMLIQDADFELDPNDIPKMIVAMKELNVQFVNGSRYLPGALRPLSSYKRYLGNKFFTFLTSILINVKLTDMACGYKLIHKNMIDQLNLKENRFGFEAELILKGLRLKKNNIAEVPVNYFPRNSGEGKKLNNLDAIKIFITIIKYGLLRLK